MGRRHFIVVGDTTTAGGKALTGISFLTIQSLSGDQRPQAFVGDQVMCGQCGPTTITSGVSHVSFDGRDAAVEGGDLTCGHKLVSTEQRLSWVEGETDWSDDLNYSRSQIGAPVSATALAGSSMYDEAFILKSKSTGKPLANRSYRIYRGGTFEAGVTDENGNTHVVASDVVEGVVIHLQEEGP
jgi:uncharacterized Zn-binding protein involved in type VI secretion